MRTLLRHAALPLALLASAPAVGQGAPDWALGLSAPQREVLESAVTGLQQRLNLAEPILRRISIVVGKSYRSRDFLAVLDDLRAKAEQAAKLQSDLRKIHVQIDALPRGTLRQDADRLLRDAQADFESGRLELADVKLAKLSDLKWGQSQVDQDLWLKAVTARAAVVNVRDGANAASAVLEAAYTESRRRNAAIQARIGIEQFEVINLDGNRQSKRTAYDAAFVAIDRANSDAQASGDLGLAVATEVRLTEVAYRLCGWDRAKCDIADRNLDLATNAIELADPETKAKVGAAYCYRYFDKCAENKFANMVEIVRAIDDSKNAESAAAAHFALGWMYHKYGDHAQIPPDEKRQWLTQAIDEYDRGIAASKTANLPYGGMVINRSNAEMSSAECCLAAQDRVAAMSAGMAEMNRFEGLFDRNTQPGSWYNVQTIIANRWQSVALERFNLAATSGDQVAKAKAIAEQCTALRHFRNADTFLTSARLAPASFEDYQRQRRVIEQNYTWMSGSRAQACV